MMTPFASQMMMRKKFPQRVKRTKPFMVLGEGRSLHLTWKDSPQKTTQMVMAFLSYPIA
jgi:hypothetical protein